MTENTVRRNIAASKKVLVAPFGMTRSAHKIALRNELSRLGAYVDAACMYGIYDALESAEKAIRAEMAWLDECSAARSSFVPAKLSGFAVECAIAAAMR